MNRGSVLWPLRLLEENQQEWIIHQSALFEEFRVSLQPFFEFLSHTRLDFHHRIWVLKEIQIFPNGFVIFRELRDATVRRPFQVVHSQDLTDMFSHEVVHDHHTDLLHVLYFDTEETIEPCDHRIRMILNVLIVLWEKAFPDQHLELRVLQCLDDKLWVSCVEEETIRLARADLEFHHLLMIRSRCKRVQKRESIKSRLSPDLFADVSFILCNLDLNAFPTSHIRYTKLWVFAIKISHVHNMYNLVIGVVKLESKAFNGIQQVSS